MNKFVVMFVVVFVVAYTLVASFVSQYNVKADGVDHSQCVESQSYVYAGISDTGECMYFANGDYATIVMESDR